MTAIDDPIEPTLIARILGEYREMPGLALTIDQAQRLWGFDAATARRVIDALMARGVLQWSRDRRVISR